MFKIIEKFKYFKKEDDINGKKIIQPIQDVGFIYRINCSFNNFHNSQSLTIQINKASQQSNNNPIAIAITGHPTAS